MSGPATKARINAKTNVRPEFTYIMMQSYKSSAPRQIIFLIDLGLAVKFICSRYPWTNITFGLDDPYRGNVGLETRLTGYRFAHPQPSHPGQFDSRA